MSTRFAVPVTVVSLLALGVVFAQAPAPPAKPEAPAMKTPAGFKAVSGTEPEPYTKTGWAKEVVHERTGVEMVFIPAGEFTMGSPEKEENHGSDELEHKVKISRPFYMGKYEFTQGQTLKAMGANPSSFKGSDKLPLDTVCWDDCQQIVAAINKKASSSNFHLPTEAQWEYAARAGSKTAFFFSQWNTDMDKYAWTNGNSDKKTHEVGQLKPNPWGLYDIYGNVWEWCQDCYDTNYYKTSPSDDPKGPAKGTDRVMRGGAWNDYRWATRSAWRRGFPAGPKGGNGMGMRIIYELK